MCLGQPFRSNPLGELAQLRWTGTVQEYQKQFLALLCRTEHLTPRQQVQLFTASLLKPLKIDVELQNPSNLQIAMSLARAYKRRSKEIGQEINSDHKSSLWAPVIQSSSTPVQVTSAKNGAPPGNTSLGVLGTAPIARAMSLVPGAQNTRFRRLTTEEMNERMLKGMCYNCPEKFTRNHECSSKGIYLLELDDDLEDGAMADDVEISLHALIGICAGHTMQLQMAISGVSLVALVDTGSTHNFINAGTTRCINLPLQARTGLQVKVANGDRVTGSGVSKALDISIGDELFDVDCYAIPLEGFDIMLGVHWLCTLGPVLWDFDRLTMSFWWRDHLVAWRGLAVASGAPHLHTCTTADWMDALLQEFAHVFEAPRGLPPARQHEHHIHLLPGTTPIVVRLYQYPQLLKDEIERQCADMLTQGIIREYFRFLFARILGEET